MQEVGTQCQKTCAIYKIYCTICGIDPNLKKVLLPCLRGKISGIHNKSLIL